jgi:hypothetical protein
VSPKKKKKRRSPDRARIAFILAQPADMPSKEVQRLGAEAGLKFARTAVSGIRFRLRKKATQSQTAVPDPASSMAAFVRTQPLDMPAAEVVAKAAAIGLKGTVSGVYSTRSVDRYATQGARARGAGADFTRGLPYDMPAAEVVAKAAEAGLAISMASVYAAQHKMREQAQKGRPPAAGGSRAAARVSRTPKGSSAPLDASREAKRTQLKALIFELGMDEAKSIWEEFAYIWGGIRR